MESCPAFRDIATFMIISGGLISGLVTCLLWNEIKFYRRHNWNTNEDSGQNIFFSHVYMLAFFFLRRHGLRMWSKLTALLVMLAMGSLSLMFGLAFLVR